MEEYVFSAISTAFYPISLKDRYEASNTWPEDGLSVDTSVYIEFTATPPEGKKIGSIDGLPVWVDVQKKSDSDLYQDELVELALVYSKDMTSLSDSYARAALIDGVNEDDKKIAIYNEYQARKLKYQSDSDALKQKYGV